MDTTTSPSQVREQRFREIYDLVYLDVLRFVRRRAHPSHAEDVVGDVMVVAWRRLDDIPVDASAARAWLFGVARKVLLNTQRREGRRDALVVRLGADRSGLAARDGDPDLVALRADVSAAWHRLGARDQEVIALAALDGLSAAEAATVLDISPAAFRLRLSRARRRLRRFLGSTPASASGSARASERSAP